MINASCCCDKNCDYDIALLITEEKCSINAPIVATPSVSFYIQEFLGFTGTELLNNIKAGPIEAQKENSKLYKEVYENFTGKSFDGQPGCCKDKEQYFLDQSSLLFSKPKYLGTHHRDEKDVFYEGNLKNDEKYLHSFVKQTLILPEKYKNDTPPGLTLFNNLLNYTNTNRFAENVKLKSQLKSIFSLFFRNPNYLNKNYTNNNYFFLEDNSFDTIDDQGKEAIGYYWSGYLDEITLDYQRDKTIPLIQPKIRKYYLEYTGKYWSCPNPFGEGGGYENYNIESNGFICYGGQGLGTIAKLNTKVVDFDYLRKGEKKINVFYPPKSILNQYIGHTFSVQYTNSLPAFQGPEEDILLHSNGLTLGFVNPLVPLFYKLNIDEMVKSVSLVKKLIQIGPITGFNLFFRSVKNNNFNENTFSADIISYIRYLNKSDLINDSEIERLKTRYYRTKGLFKSILNKEFFTWPITDTNKRAQEYCSNISIPPITYSCEGFAQAEPKYISGFYYYDLGYMSVSNNGYVNSFKFKPNQYSKNTVAASSKKIDQNINDYFYHGLYFDLNKSFQLKKLWESHLSFYWGGFSVNDIEPTSNDTEGQENRYIKYLYPVVSLNKPLCTTTPTNQSWSVYFTVHNDVEPNNNMFEQYFWFNGNSYIKTKTKLSKYQQNVVLSVKVLRILKDKKTHLLDGVEYNDSEQKRIKFIDPEFTTPKTNKYTQETDYADTVNSPYEFSSNLQNSTIDSSIIQNQNNKKSEILSKNKVIVFENFIEENSFYSEFRLNEKYQNSLNDNITVKPTQEQWIKVNPKFSVNYYYNSVRYFINTLTNENVGGKKIVIPYLRGALNYKEDYKENDLSWQEIELSECQNRNEYKPIIKKYSDLIVAKGIAGAQSKYNLDLIDTTNLRLNEYLLYEPQESSNDYKSGYGLYKNVKLDNINYKNKKQTDLFNEWKQRTINDLLLMKLKAAAKERNVCVFGDCDALIQNLNKTTISDNLYFVNPLCRKRNISFDVKCNINDLSYIRSYSGLFNLYKKSGVYRAELGKYPTLISATNTDTSFDDIYARFKTDQIQNVISGVYKNIDIGSNNLNYSTFNNKVYKLNYYYTIMPLETVLDIPNTIEHIDKYSNETPNNWYYFQTAKDSLDSRIQNINSSLGIDYGDISLFKQIKSDNYYSLFPLENNVSRVPLIAEIDGPRHFDSKTNVIEENYLKQLKKGTIYSNLNHFTYIVNLNESKTPYDFTTLKEYYKNPITEITQIYPKNISGLVLDVDTYAFNYDFDNTKEPEIQFLMWDANIDFGSSNYKLNNLRNSYVNVGDNFYKNGWSIKTSQPDQYFFDNILESIQEKYIEYQYYEKYIDGVLETIDKLTDFELITLTPNLAQGQLKPIWFLTADYYPAFTTTGNNVTIGSCDSLAPCMCSTTEGETEMFSSGIGGDVIFNADGTVQSISGPEKSPSKYYYYDKNNVRTEIIVPNNTTQKQVNVLSSLDITSGVSEYITSETIKKYDMINDLINFYKAFKIDLKQEIKNKIIKTREKIFRPFKLLEEIFGTINVNDDIINQKNLKSFSKKIDLNNHYHVTRLEKFKNKSIVYDARDVGVKYLQDTTKQNPYKILDFIYLKNTDFIQYISSNECWPNIKRIVPITNSIFMIPQVFVNPYSVSGTSHLNGSYHFLHNIVINQNLEEIQEKNSIEKFITDPQQLSSNTDITDYNFYRHTGKYFDLSKGYECYLPNIPVSLDYEVEGSWTDIKTSSIKVYCRTKTSTYIPTYIVKTACVIPVSYVDPDFIAYFNVRLNINIDAFNKMDIFRIYNFYTYHNNYNVSTGDKYIPLQVVWNKPNGFYNKNIPSNIKITSNSEENGEFLCGITGTTVLTRYCKKQDTELGKDGTYINGIKYDYVDPYPNYLSNEPNLSKIYNALSIFKTPTKLEASDLEGNKWSDYKTFIRPKVSVKGIPNNQLKLINFYSLFKSKQFINDILYPLYSNFGQK